MALTSAGLRATMAHTEGQQASDSERIPKVRRSPDWSLQLGSMKSESLVIRVNQNVTVNTFPGLVHTARHTMGMGCKVGSLTFREDAHHFCSS